MAIIRYQWKDENSQGVTGFIDVKTSGEFVPTKDIIDQSEIIRWHMEYNGHVLSSDNGDELNYRSQQFGNTLLATKKGLFLAGAGSEWRATAYSAGIKPYVPYVQILKEGFYEGNVASIRYRGATGDGGDRNKQELFQHVLPMPNQGRYQFGDWVQIGGFPTVLEGGSTPAPTPSPNPVPNDNNLVDDIKQKMSELVALINQL